MKCADNEETFIKKMKHIVAHIGLLKENDIDFSDCFKDYYAVSYTTYKNRADKKHLEFDILRSNFYNLMLMNCYICGKETDDKNFNGIDRIDNTKGYFLGNCAPCCYNCNKIKKNYTFEKIIMKAIQISKTHGINNFKDEEYMLQNIKTYLREELKYINNEINEKIPEEINKIKDETSEEKIMDETDEINDYMDDEIYNELQKIDTKIIGSKQKVNYGDTNELDDIFELSEKKNKEMNLEDDIIEEKKMKTEKELKEYNRIKQQETRNKQKVELGEDLYKLIEADKRYRRNHNGKSKEDMGKGKTMIRTKPPMTTEEKRARKTELQRKYREDTKTEK